MATKLSPTLIKTLDILNDCTIHSGEEMAQKLNISRAAIWKIIKHLKEYNISIASSHHGYQLEAPLMLYDKKKIEELLHYPNIQLEVFESISSTNDYLKSKDVTSRLDFCLAEYQTKGRGRLGRTWISPFGKNIMLSFSCVFNKDISELSGLSLVIGILVAQALNNFDSKFNAMLKWPNDLLLNNVKVGGILVDLLAEANGSCKAVVGLGLNVNMRDEKLEGVERTWTSLDQFTHQTLDRNLIVAQIINSLAEGLEGFTKSGLKPYMQIWDTFDMLKDRTIALESAGLRVEGVGKGITKEGHLLVLAFGDMKSFSSGEATLLRY